MHPLHRSVIFMFFPFIPWRDLSPSCIRKQPFVLSCRYISALFTIPIHVGLEHLLTRVPAIQIKAKGLPSVVDSLPSMTGRCLKKEIRKTLVELIVATCKIQCKNLKYRTCTALHSYSVLPGCRLVSVGYCGNELLIQFIGGFTSTVILLVVQYDKKGYSLSSIVEASEWYQLYRLMSANSTSAVCWMDQTWDMQEFLQWYWVFASSSQRDLAACCFALLVCIQYVETWKLMQAQIAVVFLIVIARLM